MKVGQKVLCIEAKDVGIPITEGQTYTIKTIFVGPPSTHEVVKPGMENVAGVTLVEVPGYFRADRFREMP